MSLKRRRENGKKQWLLQEKSWEIEEERLVKKRNLFLLKKTFFCHFFREISFKKKNGKKIIQIMKKTLKMN